jgi:outer membrane protein assembly factor BamB
MRQILGILVLSALPTVSLAEDWPQWLGPRRDSGSETKVAPWQGDLKIVWKQPVGEGHSSPVVAGGIVYLHSRVKDTNKEIVSAFAAKDGMPVWSKDYERPKFTSLFGNGPRATPAVKDGKVYTYGITGTLSCFDAKAGTQLWQVDALKDAGATNLFFGASGSPLIEGTLVLANPGGKGASLVAYNKDDGNIVWKNLDDKASYASPIAIGDGADRQAIFLTGQGLVSVSPKDGKLFWKIPLVDKLFESSTTPVVAGNYLFASSITFGGMGLKMEKSVDGPKAEQIWTKPELNCYFSTPVAVGKDYLYVVAGAKIAIPGFGKKQGPSTALHCVEAATGKILWARPKVGTYHASLARTGDDKLLMIEEAGNLVLLDPNPTEYKELARAKICGKTWAHPAIADGRLYIRDDSELICVQLP